MPSDKQLDYLKSVFEPEEDEEMVYLIEGNVMAGPIDFGDGPVELDRDGILFATTHRVGFSIAAGWLLAGSYYYFRGYGGLLSCEPVESTSLISTTDAVKIAFIPEEEGLAEQIEYINLCMNRVIREDLDDDVAKLVDAEEHERWDAVKTTAKDLLKKQPECIPIMISLAYAHQASDEHDVAIDVWKSLIAAGISDRPAAQVEIAFCNVMLDRSEEAVEAATEAIDAKPTAEAYKWRALARESLDQQSSAFDDIRSSVKLDPSDHGAWWTYANLALARTDVPSLEEAIRQLHALGDDERVMDFECSLHHIKHNYAEAVDAGQRALEAGCCTLAIAVGFLGSALKLDRGIGLSWLPKLDEELGEDLVYQLHAADLLFAERRCQEAWDRVKTFDLPDEPVFQALRAMLRGAAMLEREEAGRAWSVLAPHANGSTSWVESEDQRTIFSTICMLAGWAAIESDRTGEGLDLLSRAERERKLEEEWLQVKLRQLLDSTHRVSGRTETAPGDRKASSYEILQKLADELGATRRFAGLAGRVKQAHAEYDEPPLIAVMGEYSVGKSTFINALLRQKELLPTGEGVTTGTITQLKYGNQERMRAVFSDGRVEEREGLTSVEDFVTETGSGSEVGDMPSRVDVFLRNEVLNRIRIVDSPGLNAPFKEHKKLTEEFLEKADAILWLFNVEAAGKSGEKDFLDKLKQHRRKAVALVNQIDLVAPDEADDAIEYVKEQFPDSFAEVLGISAWNVVKALKEDDQKREKLLKSSRMPSLESWLEGNLLEESREIKSTAALQKVREFIEEVKDRRQEFDNTVDESVTIIEDVRHSALTWVDSDLKQSVTASSTMMRSELFEAINEAASTIASKGTPESSASTAAVETVARALHQRCRELLGKHAEKVLADYSAFVGSMDSHLEGIETEDWAGVLQVSLREMELNFASWRKDLLDYIEQVESFFDGYIAGRGISWALLDVPEGSRNDNREVKRVMKDNLSFLWGRVDEASSRWMRELKSNFEESFAKLEREIHTEAAEIRSTSYRPIEKMEYAAN